jgi:hypothetical protein
MYAQDMVLYRPMHSYHGSHPAHRNTHPDKALVVSLDPRQTSQQHVVHVDLSCDSCCCSITPLSLPPGPAAAVQLPRHIDEALVLAAISVDKDVDGFHPLNIGKLTMKVMQQGGLPMACVRGCWGGVGATTSGKVPSG